MLCSKHVFPRLFMTIKILGFAGSTRTKSLNKKLVRIGLAAAEAAGAETSYLDLQHLNMPLYDEDQEGREGMPETVRTFRNAVKDADGLLIASPEYNGAPTAVLKNAIDWSTRPDPMAKDEPRGAVWGGTFVGLMCASPGSLGGLRGLTQLQLILSGINAIVLPQQVAVPAAHETIHDDGYLTHERLHTMLEGLSTSMVDMLKRIRAV